MNSSFTPKALLFSLAALAGGVLFVVLSDIPDALYELGDAAYGVKAYSLAESVWVHALKFGSECSEHGDRQGRIESRLGLMLKERGRYKDAESYLKYDLATCESVFGPGSAQTAGAMGNLASLYLAEGKSTAAETLFENGLGLVRKSFGPEDATTLGFMNDLAVAKHCTGKFSVAKALYQQVLDCYAKNAQTIAPSNMAATLTNLAELYREEGNYSKSTQLLNDALKIEQTSSPKCANGSELHTMNVLAAVDATNDDLSDAEHLYRKALEADKLEFGKAHPETARTMNNLAFVYIREGKPELARFLLTEALRVDELTLGNAHPSTAAVRNNMSSLNLN